MLIKIYTSYENFNENSILIDNDAFFYENVIASDFMDFDKEVMRNIDGAELIDATIGTIKTSRGICSIDNLSTGCKTVLNYLFLCRNPKKQVATMDISSCGANAIEELFKTVEKIKMDMNFILLHKDNLFHCSERTYMIDDIRQINNLLYL